MPLGIPHSDFLDWNEDDQDKALAFMRDKNGRCGGCGTRKEDWQDDPDAFVGHQERCPGCERLAQEQANIREGEHGIRVMLLPRELALALLEAGEGVTEPQGALT